MEVLANAAVAEICKLVDDDYAVVSLQMSQCQRENKALKRKLHLLELKMARGNAERRLRESAMNNSRPRVQINAGDRLRELSPSADGVFEQQMEVSLWTGRAAAGDTTSELIHSDSIQSKSPDVELVEPEDLLVKEEKVDQNMSRVAETEQDVPLIGDDGVVECVPCGPTGQRSSVEQQDTKSTSQNQSQTQSSRTRRIGGSSSTNSSRGVEKKEEDEQDVVLVKVEEVEPVTGTRSQTGLSIQEGLVESSTDNYRAVLPFDETTQTSTNQLPDLQESGQGFSEVSYGRSSLWTNGGDSYCHDDNLPGPSSHCAPLSYLSATLIGAEPGSSGGGLAVENSAGRGLAVESSSGFHTSVSFQQQPSVIDLSEESSPIQSAAPQSPPVTSQESSVVLAVQLRVPDTNTPASPNTQQQPQRSSNDNPLSSEYSLFELETFFTRWAPDSDSVSAPAGPLCSFTTEDSAECDQDGVIIVESEPQGSVSSAVSGGQSFSSASRVHVQPSTSQDAGSIFPASMEQNISHDQTCPGSAAAAAAAS
ncbi:hypothetical protein E3U43_008537 [Larimichthys crocea]|uniref:Uncharacterized protein n=1 Tax=Larimichthys crocea TaxID=215358 RepID=A0ACD3RUR1_LARCR|nr:hypothetical protein E3U43_008537 [Larimichthys crocea]